MQEIEEKLGYYMLDTLRYAFDRGIQKIILSKLINNDTLSLFKSQQNIQLLILPHYHFLIEHYFITQQSQNLVLINPSSLQPPFIFSQPNNYISQLQQLPQNIIQMFYPVSTNQQPFQHQQKIFSYYNFTNINYNNSFPTDNCYPNVNSFIQYSPNLDYEGEIPMNLNGNYNEIESIGDYLNQAERKEIFEITNNVFPIVNQPPIENTPIPVENTPTSDMSIDTPTYELQLMCYKTIDNK
ncbi:hypothetical protein QTN25_007227 [Entamoeba marina]